MARTYVSGRSLIQSGNIDIDELDASQKANLTRKTIEALGFRASDADLKMAMDSALVGPASSAGHVSVAGNSLLLRQLNGIIKIGTTVRVADEITGIETGGEWATETIRVRVARPVAKAEAYGDLTNIPYASYKTLTEDRGVFRGEQGFLVGRLEEEVQGADGYDAVALKREAAQESLDILRNQIAFTGVSTAARIYGMLNDPSLRPMTASSTSWLAAAGTFETITATVIGMFAEIQTASGQANLSPSARMNLVMPAGYITAMTKTSTVQASGKTVEVYLREQFPNMRFTYAPEFKGAGTTSTDDAVYLIVESNDDFNPEVQTITQVVPVRSMLLGSAKHIKGYEEDYTNATAGVIVKKPWFIARRSVAQS